MTTTIPTIDRVDTVRLAVSCESIVNTNLVDGEHLAARALRDYFAPIVDNIDEDRANLVDVDVDEPVESEYEPDWAVFAGSAFLDVTPDQWLAIADGYCLGLGLPWVRVDDGYWGPRYHQRHRIPALPDTVEPTMGILDERGITPAVSIPYTDEGWDDFTHQPQLIASFYVALLLVVDNAN